MINFKKFTEVMSEATNAFYEKAVELDSPVLNASIPSGEIVETYQRNLPVAYRENAEVKRLLQCHTCNKWLTRVGKHNIVDAMGKRLSVWDYVVLSEELHEWQSLVDAMGELVTKSTSSLEVLVKPNSKTYVKKQPNPRFGTIYITSDIPTLYHLHGDTPNYINSFVHQRHFNSLRKLVRLSTPDNVAHWKKINKSLLEEEFTGEDDLLDMCDKFAQSSLPADVKAVQRLFDYEYSIESKVKSTLWLMDNKIN